MSAPNSHTEFTVRCGPYAGGTPGTTINDNLIRNTFYLTMLGSDGDNALVMFTTGLYVVPFLDGSSHTNSNAGQVCMGAGWAACIDTAGLVIGLSGDIYPYPDFSTHPDFVVPTAGTLNGLIVDFTFSVDIVSNIMSFSCVASDVSADVTHGEIYSPALASNIGVSTIDTSSYLGPVVGASVGLSSTYSNLSYFGISGSWPNKLGAIVTSLGDPMKWTERVACAESWESV